MEQQPHEQLSDEALVPLILEESALFSHIIDRYEAKLERYITRLGVRNREDRQDVLQDIFLKVYKNLNAFNTDLTFSSWIYRIAHNEAVSWYRKRNVRPEGHLVDEADIILTLTPTKQENSEVLFDKEVSAQVLAEALDELDDKYRSVLILRYFEHKEYEEISDILKIPPGSVGTLIHRGKHRLQRLIDPDKINV